MNERSRLVLALSLALLLVALSACSQGSFPNPFATPTSTPTKTLTVTPSPTLTPTFSPTPTPTEISYVIGSVPLTEEEWSKVQQLDAIGVTSFKNRVRADFNNMLVDRSAKTISHIFPMPNDGNNYGDEFKISIYNGRGYFPLVPFRDADGNKHLLIGLVTGSGEKQVRDVVFYESYFSKLAGNTVRFKNLAPQEREQYSLLIAFLVNYAKSPNQNVVINPAMNKWILSLPTVARVKLSKGEWPTDEEFGDAVLVAVGTSILLYLK
jgi:hypothetical protein